MGVHRGKRGLSMSKIRPDALLFTSVCGSGSEFVSGHEVLEVNEVISLLLLLKRSA